LSFNKFLEPDSIESVDPEPDPRRLKWPAKKIFRYFMFKEEGYFSWRAASLIWSLESFTGIFVQHKMFSIYGPEKL
jgi:hypothetical protein